MHTLNPVRAPSFSTVFASPGSNSADLAIASANPFGETLRARRTRSILIVEDDAIVRSFVQRILGNCGFHVDVAANGEEGWEALQRQSYDLLITDHEMPVLKGLDLIARLRREGFAVPIILMSGIVLSGSASSEANNLPDAFLQKPFSIIALVTEVENQLLIGQS